ncbi:TonB-dependent siderophore receptor [Pseudomonas sp. NFIX28]|uniref:TonB-dependent siderophore receptor n=1 Tax=Pseudomonas sp. NFIX28 TaxID=1566235 RepID=UPI000B83E7EE|nr:TonB-dependent siderophore receptor [Pseudomonas sp. NFIX28]
MSMPAQHRLNLLTKALLRHAFSPKLTARALGLALALPLMGQVQAQEVAFNIPAQPLAAALQAFGQQANLQVLYSPDDIQGKRSNRLSGKQDPARAIAELLKGTGVAYSLQDSSVTILSPGAAGALELGATTISGKGLGSTTENTGSYTTGPMQTATKLALSNRETPQSVTVITRKRMDDQNMKSLEDVLKNTPGISMTKDGPQRTTYYARGFAVENLMTDGLSNDLSHYLSRDMNSSPDMAIFDRVEVVRGATGMMQGSGNPSAAINMVRKRPTATPQVNITASAGSWDNYRTEFDASNALNESGTLRGRVVTAYQTKDSFQDYTSSERSVFYGITEADLNEDTTFTFGVSNQNANNNSAWGGLPTAKDGSDLNLSRSTYLGNDWEYWDQDNTTAFSRLEYRFAENWKLLVAASKSWSDLDMFGTMPQRMGANYDQFGQYNGKYKYEDQQNSYDAYVTGPFSLFGRTHELVVGASQRELTFKGKGNYSSINTNTDLGSPGNNPKPDLSNTPWRQNRESEQKGTYLTTRLNMTDSLKVILGGRLDWYDYDVETSWNGVKYSSSLPNKVTRHLTRYAGVIYDLDQHHSVYASYTDIFRPQTELDSQNNALEPIEGKNYEIGIKGEYFDGALNASAAIFRIDQENRAKQLDMNQCSAGTSSCYEAAGEVRSQGIELEINGALAPGWELGAGYTFAEVKYIKDANEANEGRLFDTDIPRHMFKAFTTYQLPGDLNRWTVGGGIYRQNTIYNQGSNFYAPSTNYRIEQEAYTLVDLMTSYKATENVDIRLNINNVFDKKYYQSIGTNTLYGINQYGDPRNAMVTVRWSL